MTWEQLSLFTDEELGIKSAVHLTKIYTKTGDSGTTAIAGNVRIPKTDVRIAAVGSVDEANSIIGMARSKVSSHTKTALQNIQNDLFNLGADLVGSKTITIVQDNIDYLEWLIDQYNLTLEPLTSFVLPSGFLHHARAVVRRAERDCWAVEGLNPLVLVYLNRLSDLLFVMARYHDVDEVLWEPNMIHEKSNGNE